VKSEDETVWLMQMTKAVFFSLLLSNDEIKRQVLGIFTNKNYKSLYEA